MSDAPEELWCWNTELSWGGQGGGYARQLSPRPLSDHERLTGALYRRADLPPTDAQLAADPRVRALVALLREARDDLAVYVEADYPESLRCKYPDTQRRWARDMELCDRIDAVLRALAATGSEP
jgi:hypothetical protein